MVRRNRPKQLSGPDLERFLQAAEGMHRSIVSPLISPQCDHYRAMQALHGKLLQTVRDVTGKEVEFIHWYATGTVKPPAATDPA